MAEQARTHSREKNVKRPSRGLSHKAHRAALIYVSLALSQTAGPIRG